MQIEQSATNPTYIVAVSGGVDSAVMLHKIMANQSETSDTPFQKKPQFIVAHFDHGIRSDSGVDAEFVRGLADKYGLKFALGKAKLGPDASEEEARKARYDFLFSAAKAHKASAVIVAHHQDDVLETMVVNMVRGTTARGLIGFTMPGVLRPLIHMTKQDILKYAEQNNLVWREDSTNLDEDYLRNYIRRSVMPKLKSHTNDLLQVREHVAEIYDEMDMLVRKLLVQTTRHGEIVRSKFVVYPYAVQKELMATYLRIQGVEINAQMVEKAVLSAKVLRPDKHIELTKKYKLVSKKSTVSLIT